MAKKIEKPKGKVSVLVKAVPFELRDALRSRKIDMSKVAREAFFAAVVKHDGEKALGKTLETLQPARAERYEAPVRRPAWQYEGDDEDEEIDY